MKKVFSYVLLGLAALCFAACEPGTPPVPPPAPDLAEFYIEYEDEDGNVVTLNDGDSVSVTIAEINEMTDQMSFDGRIIKASEGDFEIWVDVNRETVDGTMDELCLSQCVPGNGQAFQMFSDVITEDVTPFYAHITPEDFKVYVIDYWFREAGVGVAGIHITVFYNVEAALED